MVKTTMTIQQGSAAINYDDVQGLVRFSHGQLTHSAFLLLNINDVSLARNCLGQTGITSATSVSPRPESACHIAFTASGLGVLGVEEETLNSFSAEFVSGMCSDENRSRRLGDVGSNSPQHWHWGGKANARPDVLVIVYAHAGELDHCMEKLLTEEFHRAFTVLTTLKSTSSGPREPFGFIDGISQPDIDWQQTVSTDPHDRDNYSNRLALGEVLLGYPNEYGLYTSRPLLSPSHAPDNSMLPHAIDQPAMKDLGRNGSYLVMRQLEQDVRSFWQFVEQQSDIVGTTRDELAANMVGRFTDGRPLVTVSSAAKAPAGAPSYPPDNNFDFDEDPLGEKCPVGAHIRRSNPRNGDFPPGITGILSRLIRTLGFGRKHATEDLVASTRFHRILRRGRPYGEMLSPDEALLSPTTGSADPPRGLFFLCLGANISRQFEFVQNAWSVSSKFAGLTGESDPLLGHRQPLINAEPTDRFTLAGEQCPQRRIEGLPQFVTVKGGGYFFLPGLAALEYILQPPVTPSSDG